MIIRIGRMRLQISTPEQKEKEDRLQAIQDLEDAKRREPTEQQKAESLARREQFIKEEKEWDSGKPSSKTGRDIYYSRYGFFDCWYVLNMWIREYINAHEVWYADSGQRHVHIKVIARM